MEWKVHPVTQEVLDTLQKRFEGMKDELAFTTERIEFKQGYINALNDFLNIDVKEVIHNAG